MPFFNEHEQEKVALALVEAVGGLPTCHLNSAYAQYAREKGLFDEGLRFMRYGAAGATSTALLYVVFLLWSKHPSTQSSLRAPATRQASPHYRATFASQQTHRSTLSSCLRRWIVSTLGVLYSANGMAPAQPSISP